MVRQRVERKLAAVLVADVAGYSRLTGADEEGIVERVKALRSELIDLEILAGLPTTVVPGGTFRVTTLPAPTMASSPMLTPGRTIAPPPIQTFLPIRTGTPLS